MQRIFLLFVFYCLFFIACNTKEKEASVRVSEGSLIVSDTVNSSVIVRKINGVYVQEKTNARFELLNVTVGDTIAPVLFKIISNEYIHPDSEYVNQEFMVTAKSLNDARVNWEKSFTGSEFEINNRSIILTKIVEGTDEDYIQLFSPESGELVMGYCYGGLEVMIPNTPARRYIGFTSLSCAGNPLKNNNDSGILGLLNYASNTKSLLTLKVKVQNKDFYQLIPKRTPELTLIHTDGKNASVNDGKGIILMNAGRDFKSSDISNFKVKLTWYVGDQGASTSIEIPVVNDQLNWEKAVYDKTIFTLTD